MHAMEGFIRVAPSIWYRQASPSAYTASSTSGDQPNLILLCTWLGAQHKHIIKYVTEYGRLYPNAHLLVLESSLADLTYRSNSVQQARLESIQPILQAQPDSGIVVHAFSNGGAQCAAQLAATISPTQRAHIFRALILDSCPGEASYARSAQAILLPLTKSPLLWLLAIPFVHLVLTLIFTADRIFGYENVVGRARRRLNSSDYFAPSVPRLYAYSESDRMVPPQDVAAHADEARRKGYSNVSTLCFQASSHCAHASMYREQYWDGIVSVVGPENMEARAKL